MSLNERKQGRDGKRIIIDDPTKKFLEVGKDLLIKKFKTFRNFEREYGFDPRHFFGENNYPNNEFFPTLIKLMKLAEALDYDISDSVNYRYYHDSLPIEDVKKYMCKHKIKYRDLADILGYSERYVQKVLYAKNVDLIDEAGLEFVYALKNFMKDE